ncbi:MAG TPA: protein-L-isoaspartate O-methyltransferase [Caulobacteraceae bacterium]|nr:protein-L-isoaspartate O-methyltransferase [Caulobacteraceae bacterium]
MAFDFARARDNMVESQVRTQDVTDAALLDAMRSAPRESLVPTREAWRAYAEAEIAYAPERWLMRPRDIGKLLQALEPRAGERALAIAAPYAALLLEGMGLIVRRLDEGDLKQIEGVYDVVVCEGAVCRAPDSWKAALAEGGRLGVVEREGPVARARLYLRAHDAVGARTLFDSSAPLLAGFEPPRTFTF